MSDFPTKPMSEGQVYQLLTELVEQRDAAEAATDHLMAGSYDRGWYKGNQAAYESILWFLACKGLVPREFEHLVKEVTDGV